MSHPFVKRFTTTFPSFFTLALLTLAMAIGPLTLLANAGAADTLFNQTDSKGRKQGYWKRHYRNGQVAYRAQFKNGVPVGTTRRYAASGRLEVEIQHMPDGHIDYVTYYDEKGEKMVPRAKFYDRKKDSTWNYYANGKPVRVEHWKRGVKHGEFTIYSDQGTPARRENWHNGLLQGPQDEYYGNGKLRIRWFMERDTAHGKVFTLFPNGLPRLVGVYRKGQRDSVWTVYNSLGKQEMQLTYKEGNLVGEDSIQRAMGSAFDKLLNNAGKIPEPSETFQERY